MHDNDLKKRLYRSFLNQLAKRAGVKMAKETDASLRFGRRLNLDKPRTLADKVSWIELNTDQESAARCTDKYEVRRYIESKGFEEILIPLVGGPWSRITDIDVSRLPNQFVLKAAHGCEMNFICKDKSSLDESHMFRLAAEWLKRDYPRACIEPHYKLIPHRLYCEKYIGGIDDVIDYKIHCINGNPEFILTCSNRTRALKLNLYDLDWNALPGLQGDMRNEEEIARPRLLTDMVGIAKELSENFDFVRVDLYETNGRVQFGELTFSPAAGVFPYFSDSFISRWGKELHVSGIG